MSHAADRIDILLECKSCEIKDNIPYMKLRNKKCDSHGITNHTIFPKLPSWGLYNEDNLKYPRSDYYAIVDIEDIPKTMNGYYIGNIEGYILRIVNSSDMIFEKGHSYLFKNPSFGSKEIREEESGSFKRVPVALISQDSVSNIFNLVGLNRREYVAALFVKIVFSHRKGKTYAEILKILKMAQGSVVDITCENCLKKAVNKLVCSTCKGVLYCNRECQVADWKRHKSNCVVIQLVNKLYDWIQLKESSLELIA